MYLLTLPAINHILFRYIPASKILYLLTLPAINHLFRYIPASKILYLLTLPAINHILFRYIPASKILYLLTLPAALPLSMASRIVNRLTALLPRYFYYYFRTIRRNVMLYTTKVFRLQNTQNTHTHIIQKGILYWKTSFKNVWYSNTNHTQIWYTRYKY